MKLLPYAMGLSFGLLPTVAWAVPSNFGHPYPMPRGMLAAAALGQFQPGEGVTAGLGGAYGLTSAQGLSFSATRAPSGDYALGLGAGHSFGFWGNHAKLGVSASKLVGDAPVAGAVALDIGRALTDRISVYGEVGRAISAGAPGTLRYATALEYALTRDLSVDVEYLGGITPAGHNGLLCSDLSLALGRGQITATVMVPQSPVLGSLTYTVGTSWRLI